MRLDRHFERNRPTYGSTFQFERRKYFFAKHFDSSRCVGERRAGQTMEQPVRPVGKKSADCRTTKSPAAMRVACAADEIAPVLNQCDHVFDRQYRTHFIGGENEDDVAL